MWLRDYHTQVILSGRNTKQTNKQNLIYLGTWQVIYILGAVFPDFFLDRKLLHIKRRVILGSQYYLNRAYNKWRKKRILFSQKGIYYFCLKPRIYQGKQNKTLLRQSSTCPNLSTLCHIWNTSTEIRHILLTETYVKIWQKRLLKESKF